MIFLCEAAKVQKMILSQVHTSSYISVIHLCLSQYSKLENNVYVFTLDMLVYDEILGDLVPSQRLLP
jgi:hypothetical protein